MRNLLFTTILCFILVSCAGTPPAVTEPETVKDPEETAMHTAQDIISGTWQGDIVAGPQKIRTVLHIEKSENGTLTATLDSPDQGAFAIPVSGITHEGPDITFTLDAVKASYKARLTQTGGLSGTWYQGGGSFALTMKKLDKAPDYSKPQDPKKPYPYIAKDVTFRNSAAGITIAGTLTYPTGAKAEKAVVLISGSGPQNRDEELMGHRPFLVLSDYLTRNGIAVLRFDDRGTGESQGDFSTATSRDLADDVEAAIEYLKTQNLVRIDSIGLVGHSEGGLIAPMIASDNKDVDFIVLMAGPGVPGKNLILMQTEAIMKASGMAAAAVQQAVAINSEIYDMVIASETVAEAQEKLRGELPKYGIGKDQIDSVIAQAANPWFKYFLSYDPAPALQKVKIPVLAVNGTLDLQVPSQENLAGIRESLLKAGNTAVTIREFEGLNHLFQPAATGLMNEYGTIRITLDQAVLEAVSSWISGLR